MALCSLGSTGLPHPSDSALVSHHSACTMDFWAFSWALSFHPFNSGGLLLPSSSALFLGCSSTLAPPRLFVTVVPPWSPGPLSPPWLLPRLLRGLASWESGWRFHPGFYLINSSFDYTSVISVPALHPPPKLLPTLLWDFDCDLWYVWPEVVLRRLIGVWQSTAIAIWKQSVPSYSMDERTSSTAQPGKDWASCLPCHYDSTA